MPKVKKDKNNEKKDNRQWINDNLLEMYSLGIWGFEDLAYAELKVSFAELKVDNLMIVESRHGTTVQFNVAMQWFALWFRGVKGFKV